MTTTSSTFIDRSSAILSHLEETGQLKQLQLIESPMGPWISIRGKGEVDCFCSNNYLGVIILGSRVRPFWNVMLLCLHVTAYVDVWMKVHASHASLRCQRRFVVPLEKRCETLKA